jgi:predicted NBD/HSP70 family sugar kinase
MESTAIGTADIHADTSAAGEALGNHAQWVTEFHRSPNRMKVLQLIRSEGPVSRAEIARRLDLSRPTASRIIDTLMREGIIACVGKSQPTGGRLGDLYAFRLDAGVVLGLQLGTRDARAAVASLNGDILHRTTRALALGKRQSVLPQLRAFIEDALAEDRRRAVSVLAVGLAVPGVVDIEAGKVSYPASPFPGLSDRPLLRELEQHLRVPVVMDNDVNFAALGECRSGCAQGHGGVAFIFVGPGIGAGLILNGQLLRGSSGAAGEIGYMVVDRASVRRRYAPLGCLETVAGIDHLTTAAKKRGLLCKTPDAVCEAAMAGDRRAREVIDELNEYLAAAVINTVSVIDPEIVVLGGDLADLPHAQALFVTPIEAMVRRHVVGAPLVRLSQLLGDAALHGALHAAVELALATSGRSGGPAGSAAHEKIPVAAADD